MLVNLTEEDLTAIGRAAEHSRAMARTNDYFRDEWNAQADRLRAIVNRARGKNPREGENDE